MINNCSIKFLIALTVGIPFTAIADASLVCKGEINKSVDSSFYNPEKAILDINIYESENLAIIHGNWGCPNLATLNHGKPFPCIEVPISIKQNEILSSQRFSGDKVNGSYLFTLNRNSGVLKTSSVMSPNTNAGYRWAIFMIDGLFECELAQRKF